MDCGGIPTQLHQDYVQRPPRRRLRIVGDGGTVVGDLLAPRLEVYRAGDLIEEDSFEGFTRHDMFMAEIRHLLDCLDGRIAPVVTLRDGKAGLEVALGALQSMATGEVVTLQ
jgi:predicted dehydrogenase